MSLKSIACALAIGVALVTSSATAVGDEERKISVNQLETMYIALPALMESERTDLVDLLLRAIHSHEVRLAERDDTAARIIRARAPEREQVIELLGFAAHQYREWDAEERAETIERMVRELWGHEQRYRVRDSVAKRVGNELEIMRIARHALLEADRRDTAELVAQMIHVRELILEGYDERTVGNAMEQGPNLGQQVEILHYAAKLWDEFGHEGKAARVRELAQEYMQRFRQPQDRGGSEGRERTERRQQDFEDRIADLQAQIKALELELAEFSRAYSRLE